MKLLSLALFIPLTIAAAVVGGTPQGVDVSRFQPNTNWNTYKDKGYQFAYIKATEGAKIVDSAFKSYYAGAAKAGLIRGAYHDAKPGQSTGAAQARLFLSHGGGWRADGQTLLGAVKFDGSCGGLSKPGMVLWIKEFSNTYYKRTKRIPLVYTSTTWWSACTGNSPVFGHDHPLWLKSWGDQPGPVPVGWSTYTFWQSAGSSVTSGNQNSFNGDSTALKKFALNKS